jgi:hypothetical protein
LDIIWYALRFTKQNIGIMKDTNTLKQLKKFELSEAEQKRIKGGYAPSGFHDFLFINKKTNIWGEVEVRKPIYMPDTINSTNMAGQRRGGAVRIRK